VVHRAHDEPTILLTNDATSTARNIIASYAKRMLIENALADAVRCPNGGVAGSLHEAKAAFRAAWERRL
jgi:hypothetical protein